MSCDQEESPTLDVILAAVQASSQSSLDSLKDLSAQINALSALPTIVNDIVSRFHTFSQTTSDLFEKLSSQVDALKAENQLLAFRVIDLEDARKSQSLEISCLRTRYSDLADRLMTSDMNSLSRDLLISGVPEVNAGELHTVVQSAIASIAVKFLRAKSSRLCALKAPKIPANLA